MNQDTGFGGEDASWGLKNVNLRINIRDNGNRGVGLLGTKIRDLGLKILNPGISDPRFRVKRPRFI